MTIFRAIKKKPHSRAGGLDRALVRAGAREQRRFASVRRADHVSTSTEGAHVLLVGCGGIGCGVIPVLARAASQGRSLRFTLVDGDILEPSNLHRQVLHRSVDVGREKSASARDAILRLHPAAKVTSIPSRFTSDSRRVGRPQSMPKSRLRT